MSGKDRDGGGLAVLMLAGILALLLLVGSGGVVFFIRQAEESRLQQMIRQARSAQDAGEVAAAERAARSAIEIPKPSAAQTPESTQ